MKTKFATRVHRGFVLRSAAGVVVYDEEQDGSYRSDERALERARELWLERFADQELVAEVVVVYGYALQRRGTLQVVFERADPQFTPAAAFEDARAVAALLDAGTHVGVLGEEGVWRVELAPEREGEGEIDGAGPKSGDADLS